MNVIIVCRTLIPWHITFLNNLRKKKGLFLPVCDDYCMTFECVYFRVSPVPGSRSRFEVPRSRPTSRPWRQETYGLTSL